MSKTTIEWTQTVARDGSIHHGYTFNAWWGCSKHGLGCKNCYAETHARRFGFDIWGDDKPRRLDFSSQHWRQPLRWNDRAKKLGVRLKVFSASMGDIWENRPELEAPRDRLFKLINDTPNLDWLILTKRPVNIDILFPPSNTWWGISASTQEELTSRWNALCSRIENSYIRFVSLEPLLGLIDLGSIRADWVIGGGESGVKARWIPSVFARRLRDECLKYNIPFFWKQWGEWLPGDQFGEDEKVFLRLGKSHSGNRIDGEQWNHFPSVRG